MFIRVELVLGTIAVIGNVIISAAPPPTLVFLLRLPRHGIHLIWEMICNTIFIVVHKEEGKGGRKRVIAQPYLESLRFICFFVVGPRNGGGGGGGDV